MELDIVEYELDSDSKKAIHDILLNLMEKTKADLIVLTDDAGRLLDVMGNVKDDVHSELLSSLISGLFGAASEMSKMISAEPLEALHYESANYDVLVRFLTNRFLLGLVVNKNNTSIGTMRIFAREACVQLGNILGNIKSLKSKVVRMDVETLEKKLNKLLGSKE